MSYLEDLDYDGDYEELAKTTCSPEALTELAEDEDFHVRMEVAENIHTPVEVLGKLAKDDNGDVRCAVLDNKALSPELKEKLEKRTEIFAALNLLESGDWFGYHFSPADHLTHSGASNHDIVANAMTTIMGEDGWISLTDLDADLDPEDGGKKPEESYEDFIYRIWDFNGEQINEAIDKAKQMLNEKIIEESPEMSM